MRAGLQKSHSFIKISSAQPPRTLGAAALGFDPREMKIYTHIKHLHECLQQLYSREPNTDSKHISISRLMLNELCVPVHTVKFSEWKV